MSRTVDAVGDAVGDEIAVRAAAQPTWTALTSAVRACSACPELVVGRTQVVVGAAPVGARLLLLGEAPGAREDETGEPFVGRSGQLLDRLLAEAGTSRADVAILNTVKCRPPGNRPPTRSETAHCRGWTTRQLALLEPRLIVTLGLSATRWFLGPVTLGSVRGRVQSAQGWSILPTYHPSAALRWGPGGEPARLLAEDLAHAVRTSR